MSAQQMTALELNKMRDRFIPEESTPEERKQTRRKVAKAKRKRERQEQVSLSAAVAKDRKYAIATIIVLGLIFLGMISVSAYCASINDEINKVNREISVLQEEIDFLKVEIESGLNIATIEQKALEELGMIYPTADQFVFAEGKKAKNNNMAQAIKENAYESW